MKNEQVIVWGHVHGPYLRPAPIHVRRPVTMPTPISRIFTGKKTIASL